MALGKKEYKAATAATALAGTTVAAAYLDAKFRIGKDLGFLATVKGAEKAYLRHGKCDPKEASLFCGKRVEAETYNLQPSSIASPVTIYSNLPPQSTPMRGQYGPVPGAIHGEKHTTASLNMRVQPGSIVASYMQNSPELIFMWLSLWAIGCAPAMINCSLGADALVHCLKISTGKVMIVDEDVGCQARIQREKDRIVGELDIKIVTLSEDLKEEISNLNVSRPEDTYRDFVKGNSPAALLFTRYLNRTQVPRLN
ncbi:MAG: hypothetical protein Q9187_004134 [Circinaria calcarea]